MFSCLFQSASHLSVRIIFFKHKDVEVVYISALLKPEYMEHQRVHILNKGNWTHLKLEKKSHWYSTQNSLCVDFSHFKINLPSIDASRNESYV